jgi:hypothetical protein
MKVTEETYENQRAYMRQRVPSEESVKKLREIMLITEHRVIATLTGISYPGLSAILYRSQPTITRKSAALINHLHHQLYRAVRSTERLRETMRKF